MSPAWSLLLFLLCLPALPSSQAKRQSSEDKPLQPPTPPAAPAPEAKRPRNKSVPGSGELSTKDGHRCTWETSGEGVVSLLVRCSHAPSGEGEEKEEEGSYWCRYAGQPDLCPAYAAKSSQYWKQLVGKLKKRRRACDGEKVLKTRTCKKAPAEAHMKLAQRSGEEEEGAKRKGGGGGGGKKKSPETQAPEAMMMEEEKKKKEEEKKEEMDVAGFADERGEGEVNDMEPVQNYCAEGWHSVCSFFVKFFEG